MSTRFSAQPPYRPAKWSQCTSSTAAYSTAADAFKPCRYCLTTSKRWTMCPQNAANTGQGGVVFHRIHHGLLCLCRYHHLLLLSRLRALPAVMDTLGRPTGYFWWNWTRALGETEKTSFDPQKLGIWLLGAGIAALLAGPAHMVPPLASASPRPRISIHNGTALLRPEHTLGLGSQTPHRPFWRSPPLRTRKTFLLRHSNWLLYRHWRWHGHRPHLVPRFRTRLSQFLIFRTMRLRMGAGIKIVLTIIALCTATASAQRIAPDESWRTLDTEHFPRHFSRTSRRHGTSGQRNAQNGRMPGYPNSSSTAPHGKIDLAITDHIDVSNASATPWPSNRIIIYARPPTDSFGLAYYNDWLEYAHCTRIDAHLPH